MGGLSRIDDDPKMHVMISRAGALSGCCRRRSASPRRRWPGPPANPHAREHTHTHAQKRTRTRAHTRARAVRLPEQSCGGWGAQRGESGPVGGWEWAGGRRLHGVR